MMRVGSYIAAALPALLALSVSGQASPPIVDAASVALHAGNASNAVSLATQALDDTTLSAHDRAHVLVDRGLAHEALGERDAALIDFTEALNGHALFKPEQARAFYDRGVTLDEMAQTDDALGDYSAAIRIDPHFAAALNNRANAYRRLGKLPQAHADYVASIAAGNPRLEYPNYGLGQVAEAQGDAEAARRYYKAALVADPQFTLASQRLAALANGQVVPPPAPLPPASAPPAAATPSPGAAPAAPVNQDVIHLKPPPGVAAAAPPDDSGGGTIHLKPPAAPRPLRTAAPSLKAAVPETPGTQVQLGAWHSQGDAANAWSAIARASGDLLAGLTPQIVPVDLPGKGRYYRLRTAPSGGAGAQALCNALAAKGQACIVVKD